MRELALLPASELHRRIVTRELSPVKVLDACLEQVERHNSRLNAVVTVSEQARAEALELERKLASGTAPGPLCGLPVGIKDVTEVAGLRTTYGSPLYADHVPEEDALVVTRLREAGAIILGKTNTPEFAAGGNTWNEVFGRTRNPWNPTLSAGGSTGGGAAALASGMITLAEGTDLGGSLRIPASFCGIVGLRPSPGLVPTHPSDFAWDTLSVNGPMARTTEDVARMLQAIAGPSPLSPLRQEIAGRDFIGAVRGANARGTKLAYCPDLAGIGVDAEVEAVCRSAALSLQDAGAQVEEIELDLSSSRRHFMALRGLEMLTHHFGRRHEKLGVNVTANLEAGMAVTAAELAAAERGRSELWHRFRRFFERFDHLLTPTMAVSPFPAEQNFPATVAGKTMETYVDWIAPTFVLSLTSLPVASVPCGFDPAGMPVGLQIVGRPAAEEAVLALAAAVEARGALPSPPPSD